ncbi:hypothetical protein [Flammeovirga yaeyamensis]|nr:hypothetical protein [Flammeovirga yaeyamensis]MBB3698643.1 hypothetical protein [Flammeovirga yaeyamensis]NMF34011.1 hypothetical protein [Flammeovirga yaeyamensis]
MNNNPTISFRLFPLLMAFAILFSLGGEAVHALNQASNGTEITVLHQEDTFVDGTDLAQDFPKTISHNTQKFHWNNQFLNTFHSSFDFTLEWVNQPIFKEVIRESLRQLYAGKECIVQHYIAPNAP